MLHLKTIRDDSEEFLAITAKQNNGEFDWYGVLQWRDVDGYDIGGKHLVTAYIVSPDQLSDTEKDRACASLGMDEWPNDVSMQIEAIVDYGAGLVPIFDKVGNNKRKLEQEARQHLNMSTFLTGFYLDRPINRLGTTGWEALTGNILAGLQHA